jgi:hypothetical protein
VFFVVTWAAAAMLHSACGDVPTGGSDPARARAHVETLAGTIGVRPHGSAESALARDYIAGQLAAMGYVVRVQEADAVSAGSGLTARVRNVIARRDGSLQDAIALVSHYDSRREAAGAIDDGLGVAACLEAARILAGAPLRHSLFVLVTDAEEAGLMGARALATDPEITGRVRAFLNFDGTGGSGDVLLYEATFGTPLLAWAAGSPAPAGGSFATEIYRRLPNDTDFSILKTLDIPGLNFGAIGDSYAYHTDRDVPERLSAATLQKAVGNLISTVRELDTRDLVREDGDATYFVVPGWGGVVYGPAMTSAISVLACVLAALAWIRATAAGRRERGFAGLGLAAIGALLVAAAAAAGMLAAAWTVGAVRSESAPWYAAPWFYFGFLATSGIAAAWLTGRLVALGFARLSWLPWRAPLGIWFVTLPVWLALTAVLQTVAPAAAYVVAVPMLLTATALLAAARSSAAVRAVSAFSFALAAMVWLGDAVRLLAFMVPMFGWLPVAAPMWAYPALIAATAVMVGPPAIAVLAGRTRTRLTTSRMATIVLVPVVLTGGVAVSVPAYTESRPERRFLTSVEDDRRGEARWDASGHEDGFEPTEPIAGVTWRREPPRASGGLGAYRATASVAPLADALPALVTTAVTPDVRGVAAEITIVPRTLVGAEVRLPAGIVPVGSTLAGSRDGAVWSAAYAAVPLSGLTIRLVLDAPLEQLRDAVVVLWTSGVPGGTGPRGLPPWVPRDRSAWSVRSQFVVPVFVEPDAGVIAPPAHRLR